MVISVFLQRESNLLGALGHKIQVNQDFSKKKKSVSGKN